MYSNITELTIGSLKAAYKGCYLNDDLVLVDELAKIPFPNAPRRTRCIILGLCLKGKAQYSVDTIDHTVMPNDVILINEGLVLDNYMLSPDFSGIGMLMSYDFFHEIIQGIHELSALFLFSRTHPVFTLNSVEVKNIDFYFRALKYKVNEKDHHFRTDVVRSIMMTMIYDISNAIYRLQQINDKRQTRAEAIFASFIKLVEENFRQERRVSWYGEQLCITPKYLSETVKQVSRRTPNEWIDNFVTLEVRVLLKNSSMSIKEIAQHLNFPNQSFLGKYFKEHVGMSPSEYRKK